MSSILINKMVIILLPVIIGYICCKKGFFHHHSNVAFSKFITEVTVPCLTFYSIVTKNGAGSKTEALNVLLYSFIMLAILCILAMIIPKIFNPKFNELGIYRYIVVFNNNTFMGFPIIEAMYGEKGIFYVAMFSVINNILIYTIGIVFIKQSSKIKSKFSFKTFLNTGNIVIVISIILYFLDFKSPKTLTETTTMLGNITTPLSMVVLGISLALMHDLSKLYKNYKLYIMSFIRMVIIPLSLLILFSFFRGMSAEIRNTLVVLSAMPGATMTITFANQYEGNVDLASSYVLLSSILSIIFVPIVGHFL